MWLFSIIMSIDIPIPENPFDKAHATLADYSPKKRLPDQRKLWSQTEKNNSTGNPNEDEYKHAKWCSVLTKEQYQEWMDSYEMKPSTVCTMGSLGALMPPQPGYMTFEFSPAVSFDSDGRGGMVDAYVTPFVCKGRKQEEPVKKDGFTERDFLRCKKAMLMASGYYARHELTHVYA